MFRLCSGSTPACSPSVQVCSPSAQVKAAVAHVRRLKRNKRKGKLILSLGVFRGNSLGAKSPEGKAVTIGRMKFGDSKLPVDTSSASRERIIFLNHSISLIIPQRSHLIFFTAGHTHRMVLTSGKWRLKLSTFSQSSQKSCDTIFGSGLSRLD
jgi:hypothetical protein